MVVINHRMYYFATLAVYNYYKMNEMLQKISDSIKKFRELKNITREQMAEELSMSLSGYSKVERGEVDLSITKIYKIASVLQVEVPQILNFDASQVFNLQHSTNALGAGAKESVFNLKSDQYREKYVQLLEAEVERLKQK
ncbi:MAG: helix-turn-helix transcriptional regulator [Bacteroidia bacterium]